ncbi:mucin-5AC [Pieris brassicae]|uniref:mucin-5AC n=1 Tax=Pieris brassicae TaxID=7116 RepID=UPI001E660260|nr:mucin-5AC [Pieris brassicae]
MATVAPLCAFVLITLAGSSESAENIFKFNKALGHGKVELPASCLYEGRWYRVGAVVRTQATCLSCACVGGALSCRRRSCPPLPAPPPQCHALHRRDDCCPHIHCPDGVELRATDVSEEILSEFQHTTLALPACVEGGTVYAAGSAMRSNIACEQCFCLGGTRRCVRPQCLPAQPGCQPHPTSGACCPQRYYCEHSTTLPPLNRNPNDCQTNDGQWVEEGKPVVSTEGSCTQCFCLRGHIRCQHLSCAPSLQGCTPLVQAGQCCPHQYQCNHTEQGISQNILESFVNYLEQSKTEDRSFHSSKSTKRETTVKMLSTVADIISTATSDKLPTTNSNDKDPFETSLSTINGPDNTQTEEDFINDDTTITQLSTTEVTTDSSTTEQPESSVKIMINGTINCTSELSSTSFYNITSTNDTLKMHAQIQPRIPFTDETGIEAETFSANEIITERTHSQQLDNTEIFVINVTSSLRTNATFPSPAVVPFLSTTTVPTADPSMLADSHNISKKTKEDADYDYSEATLPPSLPNLKIIPFVAADAVVDEDLSAKESSYPVIEKEEKFPVYNSNNDRNIYSKRREDVYSPIQYPTFTNKNETEYIFTDQLTKDVQKPMEFTIGASFINAKEPKPENNLPVKGNTESEMPTKNLFSPPIQTEGGFIPKGPSIVDDYYALYPSTPSGPHFTTSMGQDREGKCSTNDGRRVEDGESINQACSSCICAWGELHCSPFPCNVPSGCFRQPPGSLDLCCGELICENGTKTKYTEKSQPLNSTHTIKQDVNDSKNTSLINMAEISITTTNSKIDDSDENDLLVKIQKVKQQTTPTFSSTTVRPQMLPVQMIPPETPQTQVNETKAQLDEYEDDDDADEGFSLGSVLQLLLSETYETTSTAPFKKIPSNVTPLPSKRSTNPPSPFTSATEARTTTTTTKKPSEFHQANEYSFIPSKTFNTVNRIDHLVLGETTAIRKSTPRPSTTKSITSTQKPFIKPTQRPITTKTVEITSKGHTGHTMETRPPNMVPGLIPGLPKLAGCNIYGRMYRVGRIIAELSTPCQECKCTELGVQCRQLTC